MSYVLLCTLIVIFARLLLPGYDYSSEEMPEPAAPQVHAEPGPVYESPRLHRRTDLPEDAKLLRLSAKDHMVTVVTTQGERSLRMRFGDAIDEADPIEGLCTHRSHWVAYDAVSHCQEVDGKPQLVLVNGDAIPVSRKYRNALMDAGLLKR